MKRVLRLLTLAGAVAGAVWYSRQQSETVTESAGGEWKARPKLQAVPDQAVSAPAPAPQASEDDLTEIKGVGPKYSQQLKELGISSFASLAAADPEALSTEFEARADVADWISQARTRSGT
jgi:predicted flap endonuclease-1-like 5' DNA nuclease